MDIAQAFPVYDVRLFRERAEAVADDYVLLRVEGSSLKLEAPSAELRNEPPAEGEQVFAQAAHPHAAYRVRVRVTDRAMGDYVALTVRQDGEIECIQRRKHFRVLTGIPVKVKVLGGEDTEAVDTRTQDINSAGARVLSPKGMEVGAVLRVTLDLADEGGAIEAQARVVRCRETKGELYDIGMRFFDLSDGERERVVDVLLRRILNL